PLAAYRQRRTCSSPDPDPTLPVRGRRRRPSSRSSGSESSEFFAGVCVMRMNGANETRIVGAADVANLYGVAGVFDRRANQRLFDRPAFSVRRARPDIPRRGRDDLIVLDLAALNLDPVAQRPARRLRRAPALAVFLGRLDIPLVVETEFAKDAFRFAIELAEFVHAREMPQQDRGAAHLLIHVEDERIAMLPALAMLAAGDKLARERPGLE